MSRSDTPYDIARATGHCAATGCELKPGDAIVATLCEQPENEAFTRIDFSHDAWEKGARPERLFSFWRTTVPDSNARQQLFVDDDLLLNIFERLADDDRPQRMAFRFVIGLILIRKKLMRHVGTQQHSDHTLWLLKPRGSDATLPPITLIDPALSDDNVREISDQLGEVLHADLG
ncbi:MAG: hypothetical protein ACR2GY_10400 [Phycisphaerales bacterium]